MTIVGVPKEVKEEEYRVAMTPAGVRELAKRGHRVIVEHNGGASSGFADDDYVSNGAKIAESPDEVFEKADIIVKVKEPLAGEWPMIRQGQTVFTYFHFAADRGLTDAMMRSGAVCVAYETVERDNYLPLLFPMSEIAGRIAPIMGSRFLAKYEGGRGILVTGASGVLPAKVVILGGGSVGANAAMVASGLNARVTILEVNIERIKKLNEIMPKNVNVVFSNDYNLMKEAMGADMLIGAVLIPGKTAPKLVNMEVFRAMGEGSVFVDVAIDQGGCSETSRPTSHRNPVYVEEGVVHYCVTNMPGIYPRTSTIALTNSTMSYVCALADKGWKAALRGDPALMKGLNIVDGKVTNHAVAESHGLEFTLFEA